MMKELNKNSLEKYAADGKMVLVEFSAPWCVYCRRLAPGIPAGHMSAVLFMANQNIPDT